MTGPSKGESGGVMEGVSYRVTTIFNIMSDNTTTLYGRKIMIEKNLIIFIIVSGSELFCF